MSTPSRIDGAGSETPRSANAVGKMSISRAWPATTTPAGNASFAHKISGTRTVVS